MKSHYDKSYSQQGSALIILMLVLVLAGMAALLTSLDHRDVKIERERKTAVALSEAKAALIGYAVTNTTVVSLGYLPNPDLGPGVNTEGSSAAVMGAADITLVGKLPWKKLGIAIQKDGSGECLWYAVSGRLKVNPTTPALNWDTQGQIDVVNAAGNIIATNLAALIVSPSQSIGAQDHQIADASLVQCGGNYDAKNYLDTYDIANAVAGQVNYFPGSANNRQAANTNNKQFVLANNDFYNDRFSFITVDEIFRMIVRRSDFSTQINSLLNDSGFRNQVELGHPQTKAVSVLGTKGADNIVCNNLSNPTNRSFCNNWKEMILLTELPVPASIMIDGAATGSCSRVVIFGGQRWGGQVRLTAGDKNTPANYLEGANLAAFAVPIANNTNFDGVSAFSASNPNADVMRCL